MHPDFVKSLEDHKWKGNVRELKNIIERAVIMCEGPVLKNEALPFDFYFDEGHSTAAFDLATVEKNHIRKLLLYTKGNKTETARLLNIGLTTLYRKIDEYHLN